MMQVAKLNHHSGNSFLDQELIERNVRFFANLFRLKTFLGIWTQQKICISQKQSKTS